MVGFPGRDIHSLPSIARQCKSPLFADDVSLYAVGKDPTTVAEKLQHDIALVTEFLQDRGLVLNTAKTEFP